jgi:hypothetical protein
VHASLRRAIDCCITNVDIHCNEIRCDGIDQQATVCGNIHGAIDKLREFENILSSTTVVAGKDSCDAVVSVYCGDSTADLLCLLR